VRTVAAGAERYAERSSVGNLLAAAKARAPDCVVAAAKRALFSLQGDFKRE